MTPCNKPCWADRHNCATGFKHLRDILDQVRHGSWSISHAVWLPAGLTGTVYGRLQDSGYFFDPVQREVEQQVMPWLVQETQNEVARRNTARSVIVPCLPLLMHSALLKLQVLNVTFRYDFQLVYTAGRYKCILKDMNTSIYMMLDLNSAVCFRLPFTCTARMMLR